MKRVFESNGSNGQFGEIQENRVLNDSRLAVVTAAIIKRHTP